MVEVAAERCEASSPQAKRRFGWGRETELNGLHKARQGICCLENLVARGLLRWEEDDPILTGHLYGRASHVRRSESEVVAALLEPIGGRGAAGLDRHGLRSP